MYGDKFTRPLTNWLDENISNNEFQQSFLLIDELNTSFNSTALKNGSEVTYLQLPLRSALIKNFKRVYQLTHQANKIVLHGLPLLNYFVVFSYLLKKTGWAIYGGADMNQLGKNPIANWFKKKALQKMAAHLTHIKGDSDWCNRYYGSNATYFETPMYLSNTVKVEPNQIYPTIVSDKPAIMLGNSADPSNNHFEMIEWLKPCAGKIKIYCPLSYGNYPKYKADVIALGKSVFGDDFIVMDQFMAIDAYKKFLTEQIQMAVFNHKRQEAMGVTLLLVALGKSVFVYANTTSFVALRNKGIHLLDNAIIQKNPETVLHIKSAQVPVSALNTYYSEQALLAGWKSYYAA